MKKMLMVSGLVYMTMCIGVCTVVICKPDLYGKWIGKMMDGMSEGFKSLEDL